MFLLVSAIIYIPLQKFVDYARLSDSATQGPVDEEDSLDANKMLSVD